MPSNLERISAIWREQSNAYCEQLTDDILAQAGPSYTNIARDQMMVASHQVVGAWQNAFDSNDSAPIREFARQMGRRRAESHVMIDDIMRVVDIIRQGIWQVLARAYEGTDWDIETVAQLESWLHQMRNSVVTSYGLTLQATEEGLADREQAIEMQRRLISELSTPIVPIHAGVLVLPLVGTIDARRATQILEATLDQIVVTQAEILILDITGVPFIDTSAANHILQMARAITLLGAKCVLVGIGAEIAQTLVQLGIDLSSIITKANLQEGIVYALDQLGLAIQATRRQRTPAAHPQGLTNIQASQGMI
jgi:rsbT co-antagonist protein RsbR